MSNYTQRSDESKLMRHADIGRWHRQARNSQHESYLSLVAGCRRDDGGRTTRTDAHRDIRTTMNVFGDVVTNEMQEAHSIVGTDGPAETELICK